MVDVPHTQAEAEKFLAEVFPDDHQRAVFLAFKLTPEGKKALSEYADARVHVMEADKTINADISREKEKLQGIIDRPLPARSFVATLMTPADEVLFPQDSGPIKYAKNKLAVFNSNQPTDGLNDSEQGRKLVLEEHEATKAVSGKYNTLMDRFVAFGTKDGIFKREELMGMGDGITKVADMQGAVRADQKAEEAKQEEVRKQQEKTKQDMSSALDKLSINDIKMPVTPQGKINATPSGKSVV